MNTVSSKSTGSTVTIISTMHVSIPMEISSYLFRNVSERNDFSINNSITLDGKIVDALDLYVPPVLIILGAVCNILVIVIMRSTYFQNVSTSLYISVNALVDFGSLVFVLPPHWIHVNFPWIISHGPNSDIMCKVLNFLGWYTSDYGIILTVAMTIERAIAMRFPLKAASWCTLRKVKRVIFSLGIVILLKDFHIAIKSTLVEKDVSDRLCTYDTSDATYMYFVDNVWPHLHNVFLGISFILIIISNIIIVRSVRESDSLAIVFNSRRQQPNGSYVGRVSSRSRQLSIMMISDSLTIVVCTLPFAVFTTLEANIQLFQNTSEDGAKRHLLFSISLYLLYVNRCANFFLYCFSGQRFRLALKELCCCKIQRYESDTGHSEIMRRAFTDSNYTISTISLNDQRMSKFTSLNPI
ncbi:hypothetical protein CHS0354_017201 [Potamilus streckersoni]|uniref:G-protein coupled receptors family 1 profile domain-containing protein n=1 Tax=Potamilus streckersoni TaxID=2493646 RepID=A0AAE0W771_9BIVA|nr:hypothetical protein CHS0354_017201 [Potamilus streckersoni]